MNLRATQSLPGESLQGASGRRVQHTVCDGEALVGALSALARDFCLPLDRHPVAGPMPPPHRIAFPLKLFLVPHFLAGCSPADARRALVESGDRRVGTSFSDAHVTLPEALQ